MKTLKDGRPFDDPNQIRSVFYAVRVLGKDKRVLVDVNNVDWLEKNLNWTREKAIYWEATSGRQYKYLPETV